MSEKVSGELMKKTRLSLSKVLKKSRVSDKLLERPPFQFIYDIVMAIIDESDCFRNVFTKLEIKNIENFKTKESKIEFLKKLISSIESGLGIRLDVSPAKIVAGKEPSKTNVLLQKLVLFAQTKPAAVINNEKMPANTQPKSCANLSDLLIEMDPTKTLMSKLLQLMDQLNANIQPMTKEYENLVKEEQALDKQLTQKQMLSVVENDEIVALKKLIGNNEQLICNYRNQIESIKERIDDNYVNLKKTIR